MRAVAWWARKRCVLSTAILPIRCAMAQGGVELSQLSALGGCDRLASWFLAGRRAAPP